MSLWHLSRDPVISATNTDHCDEYSTVGVCSHGDGLLHHRALSVGL